MSRPHGPPGHPAEAPPPRPVPVVALVVVAITIVGLTVIGVVVHAGDGGSEAPAPAHMVAPEGVLDLSRVSDPVAAEFRFAGEHRDHLRAFRCWCGCEAAFDHRSLADCFVRSDGRWEAHGAGCAVCLAEARVARLALEAGIAPERIAADLDAQFGPDPTLSVPETTEPVS